MTNVLEFPAPVVVKDVILEHVFDLDCEEPEGSIKRSVSLIQFTPALLTKLWDKQKNFRTLMGREVFSFAEFVDFFVSYEQDGSIRPRGLFFLISGPDSDSDGIFWLSNIIYPAYAEAQFTFFDGRYTGRLDLVRKIIQYIFETWQIQCLYMQVGLFAKGPLSFIESLGFKKEGRLRNRIQYKGQWWDMNVYSVLKSEAQRWIFKP